MFDNNISKILYHTLENLTPMTVFMGRSSGLTYNVLEDNATKQI